MTGRPTPRIAQAARRRWGRAALAWAAAGLAGRSAMAADDGAPAKGDRVAWPEVHLLDGRLLPAPALRQQAAVLVFFSTTCPYCMRHNQHVQKLAAASAALPLQVLGVALDRDADEVRRYLAQRGLRFDVTLDERPLRAVLSRRRVIPLTCVLDREGRLREVIPGEMFEDDVLGLARWATA
jgi:peroxiredoxin